jgi:hypothetical protein
MRHRQSQVCDAGFEVIIPNAFGERAVLELMFGALIRAAER